MVGGARGLYREDGPGGSSERFQAFIFLRRLMGTEVEEREVVCIFLSAAPLQSDAILTRPQQWGVFLFMN